MSQGNLYAESQSLRLTRSIIYSNSFHICNPLNIKEFRPQAKAETEESTHVINKRLSEPRVKKGITNEESGSDNCDVLESCRRSVEKKETNK